MFTRKRSVLHYTLTGVWLLLMVSLSVWWFIFGLGQLDKLNELGSDIGAELSRQQRMLMGEGIFLVVGVLCGGCALIYFTNRESKRHQEVEAFFAAFTHDLKTSLASLRLQIESLQEDVSADSPLVNRLVTDSVRLQMQLENSLFLRNLEKTTIFSQPIEVSELLGNVRHDWPEMEIALEESPRVLGDMRALESVVRNLISNALSHGNATRMTIHVDRPRSGRVRLVFEDNGGGGDARIEGKRSRGDLMKNTGMGLYISRHLMEHMGGSLEILPREEQGFRVAVELEEVSS